MENTLLQSLLQADLLNIGDSDERLEHIERSIADLGKKLADEQDLLPAYTLVGLDPNVSGEDPVLIKVEKIVTAHWKALRSKFSDRPVSILRAVILHALHDAGKTDPVVAAIIYLTASNFYPYAKLGREKQIVEEIVTELGEAAEKNASSEWSLEEKSPALKLGALKVTGLKVEAVNVDQDALKAKLKTAAARSPQGHDPYNHPNEWATHFSNTAALGITDAIVNAFGQLDKTLSASGIETSINKFLTEFKKNLDGVLQESFQSITAVERRSKLLWWKETLYSSILKNSYRTVSDVMQPIVMAADLYQLLPKLVPVSVDFLLRDTLLMINSSADKKIPYSDLLTSLITKDNEALLQGCLDDTDHADGRIPITDFISLAAYGKEKATSLKKYTGIDPSETVSLCDIAVAILHNKMANYLIPNED
ncbi:GTPase-associated system all-helical protein GASH [Asinibacterium sp. OR53]|uniref:GTPase-associated system all-helical protein GASH n=1 Tax=Asinibacterium sp. OR53 TaxID=925409 RepID=UPI000479C5D0|nr:GTPase-associated system all-helical protein GASH [Asinibacterium sp. OR53]